MRLKAFSLLEMMAVVAVVGALTAAGVASMSALFGTARRTEQARAALMQMRKARADALASSSGAAIEAVPRPGGGVRLTTATVPRRAGAAPCENWPNRATRVDIVDYDLLDLTFPRPDNTLCFESSGFRLMNADGTTFAPAPIAIDVFAGGGIVPETVTVQPSGAFSATFDDGVAEGLAATVNAPMPPAPDEPALHVVAPAQLEPELPVVEAEIPPDPTQPAGEPVIEAQPAPEAPPPPPPPPPCTNNTQCPAGFSCINPPGVCEPDPPGCTSDADCPDIDQECNGGTCSFGCNTHLCPPPTTGCTMCAMVYCCMEYGCPCA
jgi:prepilin-type N-terminal cleavage/methylation domain-containing protein